MTRRTSAKDAGGSGGGGDGGTARTNGTANGDDAERAGGRGPGPDLDGAACAALYDDGGGPAHRVHVPEMDVGGVLMEAAGHGDGGDTNGSAAVEKGCNGHDYHNGSNGPNGCKGRDDS